MPKKLDKCVKAVQKQGKDKSSAYAICSKSTGYKKAKGGKWKKEAKQMKESTDKTYIQDFLNCICNKEYSKANSALATAVEIKLKNRIESLRK